MVRGSRWHSTWSGGCPSAAPTGRGRDNGPLYLKLPRPLPGSWGSGEPAGWGLCERPPCIPRPHRPPTTCRRRPETVSCHRESVTASRPPRTARTRPTHPECRLQSQLDRGAARSREGRGETPHVGEDQAQSGGERGRTPVSPHQSLAQPHPSAASRPGVLRLHHGSLLGHPHPLHTLPVPPHTHSQSPPPGPAPGSARSPSRRRTHPFPPRGPAAELIINRVAGGMGRGGVGIPRLEEAPAAPAAPRRQCTRPVCADVAMAPPSPAANTHTHMRAHT